MFFPRHSASRHLNLRALLVFGLVYFLISPLCCTSVHIACPHAFCTYISFDLKTFIGNVLYRTNHVESLFASLCLQTKF